MNIDATLQQALTERRAADLYRQHRTVAFSQQAQLTLTASSCCYVAPKS